MPMGPVRARRARDLTMHASPPITVAIARFEDLLALGIRAALADDPSLSVVAHDIAPERISVVLRAHEPRVLILDVGALRDLAQVRELSVEHPHTRLVLLGADVSSAESAQLLAFGAGACLAVNTQVRDLRHAIHLASRGLQLMPRGAHRSLAGHAGHSLVTPREAEVLQLLRQGSSNAEIALALQISVETVRTHARNIFRKLGVASRRALIALPDTAAAPPVGPARRRVAPRARSRRSLHG
jgi:DNA-binding NarL/FixJ family response regulator